MFFSQATIVATFLAILSAVCAVPVRNTGVTATVNGVTYTNSRNGADVACTRGNTAWCLIRRAFNNDGNADYGIGLSLGGLTDLGIGYNEPERRNDAHDIHVGVDTGDLGLGRVAVNDDLLPSDSSVGDVDFGAGLQELGHYSSKDLGL